MTITMADETGATATQADAGTQPPAGSDTTQADASSGEHQPETISLEEARKLRSESKNLRERLKAFEDEKKKADEAQLSEQERLTRRLADTEATLAEREAALKQGAIRESARAAAAKLGYANPDVAFRLLDHSGLEVDSDGTVKNVEQQLTALAKSDPYLIASRTAGSFDTGTAGGRAAAGRTYTFADLRDATFYEANKADILLARKEGRITG
jgi:hypothetical protein